jgi:hypothetical protein
MKKIVPIIIILLTLTFGPAPVFADAAGWSCGDPVQNISEVIGLASCILSSAIIPLLVTLSVIVFIIGILKYIAGADEAAKREEGRNFMIYGIIALFVMVSIWGLVGIIQGTFNLPTIPLIPQVQGVGFAPSLAPHAIIG